MSKWNKYKFAMYIIALFSVWVGFGMSIDYQWSFFDGFFASFGLLSFSVLVFTTLLDLLGVHWGEGNICD